MKDGQLKKVEILAFTNKELTKPKKPRKFVIPINPESFSRSLEIKHDKKTPQGSQGTDAKYTSTEPEQIDFEFTLDATNTLMGYEESQKGKSVTRQLDDLLQTVYYMNGDIHRPHYLKVIWGEQFTYDCVLTKMDINYTLFHPNGEPLRAKVKVAFKGYVEQNKRVREEKKSSPDLTHVLAFEAGQTLPAMVHEIYGDQAYYRQVAFANNLTSFRNIREGQEIIYPPLQKNSTQ